MHTKQQVSIYHTTKYNNNLEIKEQLSLELREVLQLLLFHKLNVTVFQW
jgi:hypothetical protein